MLSRSRPKRRMRAESPATPRPKFLPSTSWRKGSLSHLQHRSRAQALCSKPPGRRNSQAMVSERRRRSLVVMLCMTCWAILPHPRLTSTELHSFKRIPALCSRHHRPRRGAPKPSDERALPHSITSSARASSVDGTTRPRALAVLKLIARSNLVGCSTGISPGLIPCRILSTISAARRKRSGMFAP